MNGREMSSQTSAKQTREANERPKTTQPNNQMFENADRRSRLNNKMDLKQQGEQHQGQRRLETTLC